MSFRLFSVKHSGPLHIVRGDGQTAIDLKEKQGSEAPGQSIRS